MPSFTDLLIKEMKTSVIENPCIKMYQNATLHDIEQYIRLSSSFHHFDSHILTYVWPETAKDILTGNRCKNVAKKKINLHYIKVLQLVEVKIFLRCLTLPDEHVGFVKT